MSGEIVSHKVDPNEFLVLLTQSPDVIQEMVMYHRITSGGILLVSTVGFLGVLAFAFVGIPKLVGRLTEEDRYFRMVVPLIVSFVSMLIYLAITIPMFDIFVGWMWSPKYMSAKELARMISQ